VNVAVPLGWIGRLTRAVSWHVALSLSRLLPLHRVIEAVDTITHSLVSASLFATMFPLWLIPSFHLLACMLYGCGLLESVLSWLPHFPAGEVKSVCTFTLCSLCCR
jgi:hypothetical protein